MTTPQSIGVRAPKQTRSRESWERALDAGLQLLEEGGVEALTITEVCRRAAISPTSLYARVDGLAALFAAVWERGMRHVHDTEDEIFGRLEQPASRVEQRAADAAQALSEVFERHAAFLRPVIGQASSDPALLHQGAVESRRVLDRVIAALDLADPAAAGDIARSLYAECVVRTMYGSDFFADRTESALEFRARLARIATARALQAGPRI